MYFHQVCPRKNGVPMPAPEKEVPGGGKPTCGLCVYVWNTRWVTPSVELTLATSFSICQCSSQVWLKEVNASAATRGFPYMRAAEAAGLIGLKLIEPTKFSVIGCQNSHIGTSANL